MMIDIPHERGMAEADTEYDANSQCRFPLFDFIKPFEVQWMLIIYTIMYLGIYLIIC
jgi:vitamin K-dependent gamma-carboxylase